MRRIRVGVIVVCGLVTASLDVVLALTLLGQAAPADGGGLLAWIAMLVVSVCFLTAVAIVLLYCASDWGWCWPGWGFGLLYPLLVAEELGGRSGAYGSPAPLVLVCCYLTTIPFQLAVWARRTATRPPRHRPEQARLEWPHTVQRVFQVPAQESRSATLAEDSPSVQGWNSVAKRR